ncbi:unnamed protein product [Spirodela intermedia]|uniref:Uncharacterized protein n=1 Tax=Spirodela intermedia TaxID=51605 RepID=A0A7I8JHZ1_SPIIN|nr:unnamed protein product [Spirodela intermedia]CAA6669758.1 unnamed protein product [Spirodela intermedia]
MDLSAAVNLCQQGLKGHLNKVKPLLDELGSLLEDGLATMQAVNRNSLREGSEIGDYQAEWSWEETEALLPSVESLLLTSILMRATYSMLKCDYEMQERIILSLGLGSSLEELEGYCLMWDLRPFIDDDMMQHCWRLIPQTCAPK